MVSNLMIQLRRARHRRPQQVPHGQPMMPRMDIYDDPNSEMIVAHVEIPGMRKEDVTLQVHEGTLTVAGERRPAAGGEWLSTQTADSDVASTTSSSTSPSGQPARTPPNKFRVQELKYGRFKRVISIPAGLDAKEISASLVDGMLLVTWPREPAAVQNLAIDVD